MCRDVYMKGQILVEWNPICALYALLIAIDTLRIRKGYLNMYNTFIYLLHGKSGCGKIVNCRYIFLSPSH